MNIIIISFILIAATTGVIAVILQIFNIKRSSDWKNWGDHPIVVAIAMLAALISIYVFITGTTSILSGCKSSPVNPDDGVSVPLSSGTWYVVEKWNNSPAIRTNDFLVLQGPGDVKAEVIGGSRAWECSDRQSAYNEAIRVAKGYKMNNPSVTVLDPNGEEIK